MIPEVLILSAFVCLYAIFLPIINDAKLQAVRVESGKRKRYPVK
jgi:hypothetical protein